LIELTFAASGNPEMGKCFRDAKPATETEHSCRKSDAAVALIVVYAVAAS
jgi:hypothetical protein